MAMSQDEFVGLLTPAQLRFFSAAIRGGLALYADPDNYSAKVLVDHISNKALRAQIRNVHIVQEARRLIAADPTLGVYEKRFGNRVLFVVGAHTWASFKLLDDNLRARNYPTVQAMKFQNQLWPELDLPEVAEDVGTVPLQQALWKVGELQGMTNVWVGYKPDQSDTLFEFYIVCPDGDDNAWEWPLSEGDIAELAAASQPGKTDAAKKARRRVNVRPGAIKRQGTNGSLA